MTFIEIYLTAGLAIWGLVTLLWILSVIVRDSSVIDPFWGAGFVVAAWIYFFQTSDGLPVRSWLITILVTVWGLRLSLYLLWRGWGEGEDFRYQEFRKNGGDAFWWQSYFKIFLLQGLIMWIISAPLLAAQHSTASASLTVLDALGVLIWIIGFYFEAVGDWQLVRFKSDPANRGKLLTSGLWRYTRHPNYFGDAAQWWGFYLIAAGAGALWTVFSPIIMTILLLRISGVTLLEKSLKEKKPGYQEYIESTNAFLPWFPQEQQKQQPSSAKS